MLDKIHAHILDELKINARADTIFVIAAIIMNFITLAINSSIASLGETAAVKTMAAMFCFAALTIIVCTVSEIGLIRGRRASGKLINGLVQMYKDNGVDKYYDPSLLKHYKSRYNLFLLVILSTGLVALVVPFIGK